MRLQLSFTYITLFSTASILIQFAKGQGSTIQLSTIKNNNSNTDTKMATAKTQQTKTIYLIRHAESEENRRLGSLRSSIKGLCKFQIPKQQDVMASMELLNVSAQIDSDVSPKGQEQIEQLGKRIAKDDFVQKMGIELVAHSPLKRARQTSHGMVQCATPVDSDNNDTHKNNDPSAAGSKHPSVNRVVQLELLTERTPMEWLPTHFGSYSKRIKQFEHWLSEQPETVVAIVGHSQYFRSMLGLKSKFNNVDVWSLDFDPEKIRERNDLNTDASNGNEEQDERIDGNGRNNEDEKEEVVGHTGIVTEIDGMPLKDLDLPPGWTQLKHHYRYDSNYTD